MACMARKVEAKLQSLALNAGIADLKKTLSSLLPLVMMLKWWVSTWD